MNIMLGVLLLCVVGLGAIVIEMRLELKRKRGLENGALTTLVKSILKAYVKQIEYDHDIKQASNEIDEVNGKLQEIFSMCDACKICDNDKGGD